MHTTPDNRWAAEYLTSAASVAAANLATHPLDVLRVRLQLQRGRPEGGRLPGLLSTSLQLVQREGARALYAGLGPALVRGVTYGGLRLGLYGPLQRLLGGGEGAPPSFWRNLSAGAGSGVLAAALCNPLDLVKTRLQTPSGSGRARGGAAAVAAHVLRTEGLRGFWVGTTPSMVRAAVLTATQFTSYDAVKRSLLHLSGTRDGFWAKLATAMLTGVVSTTLVAPFDRCKTLMFARGEERETRMVRVFVNLLRAEGPPGLLRGWSAQYLRLGPQTTVIFLCLDYTRLLLGLEAL